MRNTSGKITVNRLREVLDYNPETGVFQWRDVDAVLRRLRGKPAGKSKNGYVRVCIDYQAYQASSLAWFWVHGEWPARNLWFRDGNRSNAAIGNLQFGEVDHKDPEARRKYYRKYDAANPQRAHAKRIKFNYGVTIEQYREMLVAQKGVCAICEKPETMAQGGRIVPLSVDHDHADDTVRGLLCRVCNAMLGQAKDNLDTLRAAISYLESHAAKPKSNIIPLSGRRIAKGNT